MKRYNKSIGYYKNYYNLNLMLCLNFYTFLNKKLNLFNRLNSYLISYPVLYKKINFFKFNCSIVKKTSTVFHLNQTIILEGYISRKKCIFTLPVFSFLNKIQIYNINN